jgi:hypothetical protein
VASLADNKSIIAVLCAALLVYLQIDRRLVNPIDAAAAFSRACSKVRTVQISSQYNIRKANQ